MPLFHKRATFYFLLCGTLVMIFIMARTGAPLKTMATPGGILELEFASSKEQVDSVIHAWKHSPAISGNVIGWATLNTAFDFAFLLFYSFFLYSSCLQLSAMLANKKGIGNWLLKMAPMALLAGFLDIVENFGMLRSLSGQSSDIIAGITFFSASLKWLLVVLLLLSLIAGLWKKLQENRRINGYN